MQKLLTFFSKNINVFAIFQDRNFNVTLANNSLSLNNWALIFFLTSPWQRMFWILPPMSMENMFPWRNKQSFVNATDTTNVTKE